MEEEPIYLDNFELALQMKEAGFDKKCAFRAVNYSFHELVTRKNFEHLHIMYGYVNIPFATHYSSPACFSGSKETLHLPTLGEIDLPKYLLVVQLADVFAVAEIIKGTFKINIELNTLKTELEARCHAWLWANKDNKINQ